jgi:hypothetical protein
MIHLYLSGSKGIESCDISSSCALRVLMFLRILLCLAFQQGPVKYLLGVCAYCKRVFWKLGCLAHLTLLGLECAVSVLASST